MPADDKSQRNIEKFENILAQSVADQSLHKLTLSKYRGAIPSLKNIFIRLVLLKQTPHLSFIFRYERKDETHNFPIPEGLARVKKLLGAEFTAAHLTTSERSAQLLFSRKGEASLSISNQPPITRESLTDSTSHDRPRSRILSGRKGHWLELLGITDSQGKPKMGDKFRQIQRFVEILSHLYTELDEPSSNPLRIVDMGAGKGYLTFAAHEYFSEILSRPTETIGIEQRSDLVNNCNRVADDIGISGLRFQQGTISSADIGHADIVLALHACDTATDDALHKALLAQTKLIVVSPCCHKEIRKQLSVPDVLAPLLKFGIHQERQSEMITDAIRALLLEGEGYKTNIIEFVAPEYTHKNLLITAVKTPAQNREKSRKKLEELKNFFGIRHQELETKLHSSNG